MLLDVLHHLGQPAPFPFVSACLHLGLFDQLHLFPKLLAFLFHGVLQSAVLFLQGRVRLLQLLHLVSQGIIAEDQLLVLVYGAVDL